MANWDISPEEALYWYKQRIELCKTYLHRIVGTNSVTHVKEYTFKVTDKYIVELDNIPRIKCVHDTHGVDVCQSALDEIHNIKSDIADMQLIIKSHDNTLRILKQHITSFREILNSIHVVPTLQPEFPKCINSFTPLCVANYELVLTKIIELNHVLDSRSKQLEKCVADLPLKYIAVISDCQ